jgi:hypothetical protein
MIGRCQTAIRGVSGFPAASLPRLRSNPRIAPKVFIRNDFWVRGEPRKNFYPEFPVAAGKARGRHYPALFRPFGAGSAIEASFLLRPSGTRQEQRSWAPRERAGARGSAACGSLRRYGLERRARLVDKRRERGGSDGLSAGGRLVAQLQRKTRDDVGRFPNSSANPLPTEFRSPADASFVARDGIDNPLFRLCFSGERWPFSVSNREIPLTTAEIAAVSRL